jgi:hypothetical protein
MSMDSLPPADGQPIAAFSQPLDQKQMVAGQEQLTLADKTNMFVEDFDFGESFNIDTSMSAIAEQSAQVSADISKLTEQSAQVSADISKLTEQSAQVFADISKLVETRQEEETFTLFKACAVDAKLASFVEFFKDVYHILPREDDIHEMVCVLDKEFSSEDDLTSFLAKKPLLAKQKDGKLRFDDPTVFEKGEKLRFKQPNGQIEEFIADHMTEEEKVEFYAAFEKFIEQLFLEEAKSAKKEEKETKAEETPLARPQERPVHSKDKKKQRMTEKEVIHIITKYDLASKRRTINTRAATEARKAEEAEKEKDARYVERLREFINRDILKGEISMQELKRAHIVFQIGRDALKTHRPRA